MPADSDLRRPLGPSLSTRPRPWPHRNHPDHILERQNRIRGLHHWDPAHDFIWGWPQPAEAYAGLVESLTAHVVLPVSMVGPLRVDLGQYDTDPANGALV